jgi:flagellin-like hook-associated protein FlgL
LPFKKIDQQDLKKIGKNAKIKPRRGDNIMAMDNITLTSAMRSNLFSLQKTSMVLESTQKRLASGLKFQSPLDDPISFFTAQEHRLRAGDLAARKDSMSEAIQTVKAANDGIDALTNLIAQAKSLAQSARSAASTQALEYGSQYNEVRSQITLLAEDSGYKGINLLNGTSETVEVKFDEDGDSSITLTGFAATASGLTISDVGSSWTSSAIATCTTTIDNALTALDNATDILRTKTKILSSKLNIITARDEFTSNLINTLQDGADKLTLADMNEEGANMLMLQTRQALGTTSLSIASQAAQSVLRLF